MNAGKQVCPAAGCARGGVVVGQSAAPLLSNPASSESPLVCGSPLIIVEPCIDPGGWAAAQNYMWHHAYVSIDEDGTGMLIVDGEQQELVTATNELDLLEGFSDPLGNTFSTTMYPTKCVVSEVATRKARSLLQVPSPDAAGLERVGDGFVDASAMLPTDAVSNATCCSFRIGQRCGGLITDGRNDENEAKPFYGMIDEVAVYNRPLDQADVRGVMWAMAANRKVHTQR